jgi:hypothetical protein
MRKPAKTEAQRSLNVLSGTLTYLLDTLAEAAKPYRIYANAWGQREFLAENRYGIALGEAEQAAGDLHFDIQHNEDVDAAELATGLARLQALIERAVAVRVKSGRGSRTAYDRLRLARNGAERAASERLPRWRDAGALTREQYNTQLRHATKPCAGGLRQ